MKKNIPCIKTIIVSALLSFPFLTLAQSVVKSVITITQNLELPVKSIPEIGWNGYKATVNAYPLQISATDTLFFGNTTQRDFVMNGIKNDGITSVTKVCVMNTDGTIVKYGGRLYNYYYYFNALYIPSLSITGLTGKANSTFTTSFSSTNNLYTVIRNYNGVASSETVTNYAALATSLAGDLSSFYGTVYLDEPLVNLGSLFFFLYPNALATPAITAGGPTTFSTGGSVVLTSSAPSGNTWYNNGIAIPGVTGKTYTATASGTYTTSTTASGFTTTRSNAIVVTINVLAPLMVSGSKLLNHSGTAVLLHAVNTASYHSGYLNDAAAISASIKTHSKVNAVRLSWNSAKYVADKYKTDPPTYFTLPYLDAMLSDYTTAHILPVLTLRDLTDANDNSVAGFTNYVVAFWTDPNLITILKKYQNNLIINLENEWGASWDGTTPAIFLSTYKSLIVQLRALGINCPIMIDAPNSGADSQFMITNGTALIAADPKKNILLSVHTYWTQENGYIVNCPADYVTMIKAMANSGLPFMLGEVSDWAVRGSDGQEFPPTLPVTFACPGATSPNKYAVNYDAILTEACNDGISYFAWSWYQDGNIVRNIYNQDTGLTINTDPNAGIFPADMLLNGKVYGLNNASIAPVW